MLDRFPPVVLSIAAGAVIIAASYVVECVALSFGAEPNVGFLVAYAAITVGVVCLALRAK